jgi:hypothetical protein
MKIHYSLSFDDMAAAMADNMRARESKAKLTAIEREAFIEGFRAGLTTGWKVIVNMPNQARDEREAVFDALASAVASWDLPIDMLVRSVDKSAATKQ